MAKITVQWIVSCTVGTENFDFEDLGCTESEWKAFTEEEKEEKLQEKLDNLPKRVSIMVDKYRISKR